LSGPPLVPGDGSDGGSGWSSWDLPAERKALKIVAIDILADPDRPCEPDLTILGH
jgi:hypothetical protein